MARVMKAYIVEAKAAIGPQPRPKTARWCFARITDRGKSLAIHM